MSMTKYVCGFLIPIATLTMSVSALLAQAAPSGNPSPGRPPKAPDKVVVTLPDKAKLPSSPGYFGFNVQVTVGRKKFPMTVNLFLPTNYFRSNDPFPIVLALHNADSEGLGGNVAGEGIAALWASDHWDDRDAQERTNLPKITLRKTAKFIGIAPQCPVGYVFSEPPMPQILSEVVTQIGNAYRTDPERAYLTGFSYGGTCCWLIAEQMPGRFAAIVPISSRNTPDPLQTAQKLKDLPIFLACGKKEWAYETCEMMKMALQKANHPDFVYRVFPDGTHWCYASVYNDPQFWRWLFTKRRKSMQLSHSDSNPQ
jgi:predicted peptidase